MPDFSQKEISVAGGHGSIGGKKTVQLNLLLNRYHRFLWLAVFLAVLLLGSYFFVYPRFKKVSQTAGAILPQAFLELEALDNYEKNVTELAALVEGFNAKYQKELSDLNQVLPNQAQLPELIAQLDALVQKNGFKITALDMTETTLEAKASDNDIIPPAGEEVFSEEGSAELSEELSEDLAAAAADVSGAGQELRVLNVNLKVVGGNYPAFKILLDKIEKHIRLLDLVSINFTAQAEAGAYDLNLRTYYFSS